MHHHADPAFATPRLHQRLPNRRWRGCGLVVVVPLLLATTVTPRASLATARPGAVDVVAIGSGAPLALAATWPMGAMAAPGRILAGLGSAGRTKWCDLAAHAIAMQPLPFDLDPIFRRLPPPEFERLNTAIEAVRSTFAAPESAAHRAAVAGLRALLLGPGGPGLCRVALRLNEPQLLTIVLPIAALQGQRHPRVAAFVHEYAAHPVPAVAAAAVDLLVKTGCDTPALFAFAGAEHADAKVRSAAIDAFVVGTEAHDDGGHFGRLLERIERHLEPVAALRVRTLRGALYLGAHDAETAGQVARGDGDVAVAAEALVVLAMVRGEVPPATLAKAIASRAAVMRAAAVRAALIIATPDELARVAAQTGDSGAFVDAVTGERLVVGAIATAGLRAMGAVPAPRPSIAR